MKISLDNYNLMEMIICLIWLYLHTHYFPIKIHSSPKFISLSNCGVGPEQVAIVCLIKLIVILKEMNEHLMKNWLKSTDKPKEHPFNSSSERSIKLNSSFDIPGPGTYNPPLHDIGISFSMQKRHPSTTSQGRRSIQFSESFFGCSEVSEIQGSIFEKAMCLSVLALMM